MINTIGVVFILCVEVLLLCLRIDNFLKAILVNVCLYIMGIWDIIGYCFFNSNIMIFVLGVLCSSLAFTNILTHLYYSDKD